MTYVLIAIVILVVIFAKMALVIIPQSETKIIERLGRYYATLNPGINIIITFIDRGMPFNPWENRDPDTSLDADEREVGGLGIFLVKKTMDDVSYEYRAGQNVLSIKKLF